MAGSMIAEDLWLHLARILHDHEKAASAGRQDGVLALLSG
jgi:hypothetical protein